MKENEWFRTLEEYIEWELRVNKGSDTYFTKEKVLEIYKELYPNVEIKKSVTKTYLVDEILKKVIALDIYNKYKDAFAIKASKWVKKFNLTPTQRKRMEKEGYLLHLSHYNREKIFTGTYADVAYYRAEDYFNYTIEEVEQWKVKNIKGYKKRQQTES